MTKGRWGFLVLFAVAMGVYATMLIWSLPHLTALAGGLMPFDLRLGGYDAETARALLVALGEEGRDFYLNVQHRLDFAYPPLIGAVLYFAIAAMLPRRWGFWRYIVALVAVPVFAFDALENAAVGDMLVAGPDAVTDTMIATASGWTFAKASWSSAVMTLVLILVVWRGVAWFMARRRAA